MKPGYTKFTEEVLRKWKEDGVTHVRSEVLKQDKKDEYDAKSAVEISPEFATYEDVNSQPINGHEVLQYAKKGNSETIYVVKEKNL